MNQKKTEEKVKPHSNTFIMFTILIMLVLYFIGSYLADTFVMPIIAEAIHESSEEKELIAKDKGIEATATIVDDGLRSEMINTYYFLQLSIDGQLVQVDVPRSEFEVPYVMPGDKIEVVVINQKILKKSLEDGEVLPIKDKDIFFGNKQDSKETIRFLHKEERFKNGTLLKNRDISK